jgi:hypothetical protein
MERNRKHYYRAQRCYQPSPAESQFAMKFAEAGLKAWVVPAVANGVCNSPYASAELCDLARRDAEKATEEFQSYAITAGIVGVVALFQAL